MFWPDDRKEFRSQNKWVLRLAQSSEVHCFHFPEQLLSVEVAEERTLNKSSMALHGIKELGQHVGLQELLLSLSGKTDTAAALQCFLPFASSTQAVKLHHFIYFTHL